MTRAAHRATEIKLNAIVIVNAIRTPVVKFGADRQADAVILKA
ncbi:MAG TPA: hypothetical protein VIH40_03800 [Xanthobacteraceae bacterium]